MRNKFYLFKQSCELLRYYRKEEEEMTEISARVEVFLSSTTVATKSNELDLASNKREREIKSVSSSQSSLSSFTIACVR